MTPAPPGLGDLVASSCQYGPEWARRCLDNRCRSTRHVVRSRRRNHLYESPVPNPIRDYPCLACGQPRVDWPHWLWPPASSTHVVQCLDCDLVLTAITIPGGKPSISQGERPC